MPCAGREQPSSATADACEATLAALTILCRRSLVTDVAQPAASPADHTSSDGQPGEPAAVAAAAAYSFAQVVAQRLGAADVRLEDAIAAEACAASASHTLTAAAEGAKRRNPYHEILAGADRCMNF